MVDVEKVKKVAHLARLELSKEEEERLGRQLVDIIEFVRQLSEVDTEGVEPFRMSTHGTPMREDIPQKGLSQEEALLNAPQRAEGFFVVPRIVEV